MKLTIAALAMSALLTTSAFAGVVVFENNGPPDHQEGHSIVVHENPNPVEAQSDAGQGQLPAVQNHGMPGQTRASLNFTRVIR